MELSHTRLHFPATLLKIFGWRIRVRVAQPIVEWGGNTSPYTYPPNDSQSFNNHPNKGEQITIFRYR